MDTVKFGELEVTKVSLNKFCDRLYQEIKDEGIESPLILVLMVINSLEITELLDDIVEEVYSSKS